MLPFLKRNNDRNVGVMVKYRKPDETETPETNDQEFLESFAKELLRSISQDDHRGALEALRSIFYILETEPHRESSHSENEGE